MSLVRRRWAVPALVLLGVLAVLAAWWVTSGGGGGPLWSAPPITSPPDAGAVGDGKTGPAAGSPADGTPRAASTGPAPPYVQPFAEQPGTPHRRLPSPTAGVDLGDGSDGCDHAYGDRSICVPWRFPAGVTDKCAWLKAHDYKPLAVRGRDRHRLDRNGDGIACGAGD